MSYRITVRDIEHDCQIVDDLYIRNEKELYDLKIHWPRYADREYHEYLVTIVDAENNPCKSFICHRLGYGIAKAIIRSFEQAAASRFINYLF